MWEEPCISGLHGSGTVFFSGCTLRCCFCQNYRISTGGFGKELRVDELADVFLRLQDQGAHNISLVTATQYLPSILPALDRVRDRLHIPVVYNCGGYERVETVRALRDYVDIWLPDLKYFDSTLSLELSGASDYFGRASEAILAMIKQTGEMKFHTFTESNSQTNPDQTKQSVSPDGNNGKSETGLKSCEVMDRGVIVRHMVLPGHRDDSIRLLHWIADTLPRDRFLISLMSQYTPYHHDDKHPELNRRITSFEYNKVVDEAIALGLTDGFMQEKSSAKEEYTPPFNLEGL
jgi:putative pyruvate formate lyase activating enzyme